MQRQGQCARLAIDGRIAVLRPLAYSTQCRTASLGAVFCNTFEIHDLRSARDLLRRIFLRAPRPFSPRFATENCGSPLLCSKNDANKYRISSHKVTRCVSNRDVFVIR